MTLIQRMVLRGFKSFAFKTDLVFGNRFNCVLGPNGSGKSNILDALCFVLGKGSAKGMRAERATNLIYNGGKTKKGAKEGEVSIFFDNSDKTFPTDDDVVKVTRIVKQNGQSVYKVNDRKRTRQQILDLLSIAKINPDGFNIILQGDIIRFVEMSTVERRQVIEEIAGISIYEEKKEKALRELDKVEEKLQQAEIILTERKTHLQELKKDRDQAMKYKELDERKNKTRATLLNMDMETKKSLNDKVLKKMESFENSVKKLQDEIEILKAKVRDKHEEIKRIDLEIEEKGEKGQIEIHKDVEQLKVDIATNKTRIGNCDTEITKVVTRRNQLQKTLVELEEKVGLMRKDREELEDTRINIVGEIEKLEDKIKAFRSDNRLDKVADIEADMDSHDANIEEKQTAMQKTREKQQELLREKDRLELQIGNMDEKINKVMEVRKENEAELKDLEQKKKEFKKTTIELNQILNEDSSIAAQLGTARAKLQTATDELTKLQSRSSVIKDNIAGSMAIKKILENKEKFGKIYDTVSNLGSVSSKFSTALEVAAGPRINSIVVDTDATAAKCIKYLKTNRLGRATFLPLNKIKSPPDEVGSDMKGANGVQGRAIDLISFDLKFKKAFSYVFGNTVIVDDIDVARRVGIGDNRMVTLDGDLVERSGAMHGGFRSKKSNIGFQEKEVMEEMKSWEKKVVDYDRLVSSLEKKKGENSEKVDRLRELKANLEGDLIKIEKSLHLEGGDLEVSQNLKKEFQESLKIVSKELSEIESSIMKDNKELAELKSKKEMLRSQVGELRSPTLLAELNTFEQKRDELQKEAVELEGQVNAVQIQVDTIMLPEKEKTHGILKEIDKEEVDFKKEITELGDRISAQEKELKEKEESEKKLYAKFKGLFTKKGTLEKEAQASETSIVQKEEQVRSAEVQLNNFSLDNARIKAEMAALEEEFKPYHNVPLLKGKTREDLKKEVWEFEKMVSQMGAVNLKALEIYETVEEEYKKLLNKKETLVLEKDDVMLMMNEIDSKKKELFLNTFDVLSEHFKTIFASLSSKGDAFLEIENPENPFEAGVRIRVRISGKKFLDIRSLSGGEKTLTALAFIFAIQEHDPASFYILDEVDAALDKRNSELLAKLLKKYSDRAQYVIISHNDSIISDADNLYGISMNEHGMSKAVSLKV